jgi:hypothetical protein
MPIQKVNQRLSDIIVNSEIEGNAAFKDEAKRHANTIVIRKSKGAPGAMTLMRQTIEGNKWYAIKYGPIYANRHATTGQITFQTKSETDDLGLDSAIKQIDEAFRQCSIYAQEHNTVPQNITDLMTISENERKIISGRNRMLCSHIHNKRSGMRGLKQHWRTTRAYTQQLTCFIPITGADSRMKNTSCH